MTALSNPLSLASALARRSLVIESRSTMKTRNDALSCWPIRTTSRLSSLGETQRTCVEDSNPELGGFVKGTVNAIYLPPWSPNTP
jgi:hypothetical protein